MNAPRYLWAGAAKDATNHLERDACWALILPDNELRYGGRPHRNLHTHAEILL